MKLKKSDRAILVTVLGFVALSVTGGLVKVAGLFLMIYGIGAYITAKREQKATAAR